MLINLQAFQSVSYTLQKRKRPPLPPSSPALAVLYDIVFEIEDTWPIYPIPYPKYDSNTGLRLGGRIDYFNVLGSLINMRLKGYSDLRITPDTHTGEKGISSWALALALNGIEIGSFDFSAGLEQQFSTKKKLGQSLHLQEKYSFHRTKIRGLFRYNFSRRISSWIAPSVILSYGYQGSDGKTARTKKNITVSFVSGFGYNNVDWIGNLRQGLAVSTECLVGYRHREDKQDVPEGHHPQVRLGGSFVYYFLGEIINPSIRLGVFWNFFDYEEEIGSLVRGVLDAYLTGTMGLYLNASLPLVIANLREFSEFQIQPFFDLGIVKRPGGNWQREDLHFGVGIDSVLFFEKTKPLLLRLSIGYDFFTPKISTAERMEIVIDSSLHF